MTRPTRVHLPSLAASLMALLLAACASGPPVQFFTLSPASGAVNASAPSDESPVQVANVHVPPSLDRSEMVRALGAHRVEIDDDHQWVAPLNQMIRRVLTQDLAQRLGSQRVILPEEPAPSGATRITLDILQFAPDASGTVHFDGNWSATRGDAVAAGHSLRLSLAAKPGNPADQARAMSAVVARIAATIAATLAHRETDTPSR